MKILYVNTWFYPNMSGGSQNSVKLLADSLISQGHDTAVFSIDKFRENEITKVDNIRLFKIVPGNYDLRYMYGKRKTFIGLLKNKKYELANKIIEEKFQEVLNIYRPNIVHFNSISGMPLSLIKIAKNHGCKTVLTLRDYFLLEFISERNSISKVINGLFRIYSRYFTKYIDIITSPSEFTLSKFREKYYFKKSKTIVIPNAVQLDIEITKRLIAEKKSTIQHEKKTFLFVGSIIDKKGIFHLIESFCRQFKHDRNISLHIAGEGAEVPRLLNKIEGHSNIVYHGSLEKRKLEGLYQNSDFLVVPSMWEEPFGRVIIEAAANALPVIVSNQGGMPEIVRELGCGEIFSIDKDENLDVILLEMSKKKNYEVYLENIENNVQKYSLQKQAISFLEVYNDLMDKKENLG